MNNEQIWEILHANQAPDPLTGAEAIVINDIKDKMGITVASEGLSPQLCAQMGFHHIEPQNLNNYIQSRLVENPDLKIGILKHSAEIMPILA